MTELIPGKLYYNIASHMMPRQIHMFLDQRKTSADGIFLFTFLFEGRRVQYVGATSLFERANARTAAITP